MALELRKAVRKFWDHVLHSPEGNAGILWLREQEPAVTPQAEPHNIIFYAGYAEGYKAAINRIYELGTDDSDSRNIDIDNP